MALSRWKDGIHLRLPQIPKQVRNGSNPSNVASPRGTITFLSLEEVRYSPISGSIPRTHEQEGLTRSNGFDFCEH